jgi:hypothetical protein
MPRPNVASSPLGDPTVYTCSPTFKRLGKNSRAIDCLLFCTAIDRRDVCDPGPAEEAPHAAPAPLGQGPVWDRDRRIDHDIGMRDEIDIARHLSELQASLCNSVLDEATIASAHGVEQSPIG